ncbi:DUF4339 domain-containing protein [Chlorobium phaeobacteroides]|uniref:GYF domain-containing protein n=1 Tax=Chlorobium phaeobacteroides (strain DSM 266 / SMG 266 / 2430) TaxID=290317 RepID=A1BG98_CHLPD|nr:DUF4339 domain-containing protein [Chlorobium phaeobacteroides]ABL65425.1 hypothetical protein Cpha266_1396 [Chlorobium phaeobacteroides DSM 266]
MRIKINNYMREYYLCVSDQWFGPMSIDKLREFPVSKDMFIWWAGLSEWKRVGDLGDQNFIFQTVPPPVDKVGKKNEPSDNFKRDVVRDLDDLVESYQGLSSFLLYVSAAVFLIFLFFVFGYFFMFLMRDQNNVFVFSVSLSVIFVFSVFIYYVSFSYRKKSAVLRRNLSKLRIKNIINAKDIDNFYDYKKRDGTVNEDEIQESNIIIKN